MASMRLISARLPGSALSCPMRTRLSSAARLIWKAYQRDDALGQYAIDE
jgi:hypothetical protein